MAVAAEVEKRTRERVRASVCLAWRGNADTAMSSDVSEKTIGDVKVKVEAEPRVEEIR